MQKNKQKQNNQKGKLSTMPTGRQAFYFIHSTFRKGFSFMEVMVVIAIIGVMTSVVLVYSGGNKIDKEVEGAAREVAAVIREAQNNALTGKNASANCQKYRVAFTGDTAQYQIILFIGGSPDEFTNCPPFPTAYDLKNGVKFDTNGGTIDFTIPWGNVSASNPIVVKKGSRCAAITVSSTGSVTEGRAESCP